MQAREKIILHNLPSAPGVERFGPASTIAPDRERSQAIIKRLDEEAKNHRGCHVRIEYRNGTYTLLTFPETEYAFERRFEKAKAIRDKRPGLKTLKQFFQ